MGFIPARQATRDRWERLICIIRLAVRTAMAPNRVPTVAVPRIEPELICIIGDPFGSHRLGGRRGEGQGQGFQGVNPPTHTHTRTPKKLIVGAGHEAPGSMREETLSLPPPVATPCP